MREAFNLFDKDKDGRITCSELLTVMKELRQQASEDEIKDMITHADEDGNYMILTWAVLMKLNIKNRVNLVKRGISDGCCPPDESYARK